MDILKQIEQEKELKGLSWHDIAQGLPISGSSLRVAFSRGSVKESYLSIIQNNLEENTVKEKPISYNVITDFENDVIDVKTNLYRLIGNLKKNHEALKEDEIYNLYCEWIHGKLEKEKAKDSVRKLIEDQQKTKSTS